MICKGSKSMVKVAGNIVEVSVAATLLILFAVPTCLAFGLGHVSPSRLPLSPLVAEPCWRSFSAPEGCSPFSLILGPTLRRRPLSIELHMAGKSNRQRKKRQKLTGDTSTPSLETVKESQLVDDEAKEIILEEPEKRDVEAAFVTSGSSSDNEGSLDSLLADARRMREKKGGKSKSDEDGFNVGNLTNDIISTIVTIDFFVVLGLLLWFLTGIFCSYVLKDDGVQIAFNNIFEPVVQPALGVLMIAAVAGAVGKDDNKD